MRSNGDAITQAERRFHVRLPEDYRHFLVTEGSMARFVPPAEDFLMIHPGAELIEINEAGEFQDRFPGSIVIGGDGGRELLTYDLCSWCMTDQQARWGSSVRFASTRP
ncbi:SMI1/KNR4 family protein [Streptomyces sp. NPDC048448]|uniref:SMI1/KNR4 family protein n=1 Tax=Streptomyces sp. NPDC048448 TaxID=3365554 RepID=UPI0037140DEF